MTRPIVFVVLTALALVAAVFVTARPVSTESSAPGSGLVRLWQLDMRRIDEIAIAFPPGKSRACRNSGIALLLSRPQVRLVADRPANPARFGLAAPRLIIAAGTPGGPRVQATVGDRLPDGTGYYISTVAGPAVYAIDYSWVEALTAACRQGPAASPRQG